MNIGWILLWFLSYMCVCVLVAVIYCLLMVPLLALCIYLCLDLKDEEARNKWNFENSGRWKSLQKDQMICTLTLW